MPFYYFLWWFPFLCFPCCFKVQLFRYHNFWKIFFSFLHYFLPLDLLVHFLTISTTLHTVIKSLLSNVLISKSLFFVFEMIIWVLCCSICNMQFVGVMSPFIPLKILFIDFSSAPWVISISSRFLVYIYLFCSFSFRGLSQVSGYPLLAMSYYGGKIHLI